ncbi:MAG: Coenzyme F420 hydrogenase/dehydrogenase, beta subunit C-terminal domain, partial [Promethearchaeota archaeon]
FLFDISKVSKLEKDFKIKFTDIEKINIKEDLIFRLKGDKVVHIPFNRLNYYMRPACNACGDFTNIYADISFGGLGSPNKYTTVITRTKKGKNIFTKALDAGIIKNLDLDQAKKKKMVDLISQYSQSKLQRQQNFMNNLK